MTMHDDHDRNEHHVLDKQLDTGLKESFPASDPVSVGNATREAPEGMPIDRKPARIDHELVKRLAEELPAEPETDSKEEQPRK